MNFKGIIVTNIVLSPCLQCSHEEKISTDKILLSLIGSKNRSGVTENQEPDLSWMLPDLIQICHDLNWPVPDVTCNDNLKYNLKRRCYCSCVLFYAPRIEIRLTYNIRRINYIAEIVQYFEPKRKLTNWWRRSRQVRFLVFSSRSKSIRSGFRLTWHVPSPLIISYTFLGDCVRKFDLNFQLFQPFP